MDLIQRLRRAALRAVLAALLAPAVAAAAGLCGATREIDVTRFKELTGTRRVTFVAIDTASGRCHVVDRPGSAVRQTPWGTFEIAQFVIALETGAASPDQPFPWDAARHPKAAWWPAAWAQDQTLRSAFEASAPWPFEDLAPRIGTAAYRRALARFGYGNAKVADAGAAFWADGSLRISPLEQATFLARLLQGELGVSAGSLAALEAAATLDEAQGYTLYGKDAAGPVQAGRLDGAFDGWQVGYVRRPGDAAPVVFALHVRGPSFQTIRPFRRLAALQLLAQIGAWPVAPMR